MAWRFHGRASVNPTSPRAFGVCDRCYMLYNLDHLAWQYDWRGPRLTNLRILVCARCYDRPQEQLRPRILPPDPVPVMNPRPENYALDNLGGAAPAKPPPPPPPPGGQGLTSDDGILLTADDGTTVLFSDGPLPPPPPPPPGGVVLTDDFGNVLTDDFGNVLTT